LRISATAHRRAVLPITPSPFDNPDEAIENLPATKLRIGAQAFVIFLSRDL